MTNELPSRIEQLEAQLIPELKASAIEQKPISLNVEMVGILRNTLEESGVNFNITSKEREALVSGNMLRTRVIFNRVFEPNTIEIYDYEEKAWKEFGDVEPTDRSLGMLAMLGEERFTDLVDFCNAQMAMVNFDGRIGKKKHEGTRGRGYTQAAADILQIALQDPSEESLSEDTVRALARLNKRFFKGLLKTTPADEHEDIIARFEAVGIEEPKKTLASFEPKMLATLIRHISLTGTEPLKRKTTP